MIEKKIYKFGEEALILRDLLATDRTVLANERTFLAYIRTALSIIVAGASFIKFFDINLINILGFCFIPFGFLILAMGIYKFIQWNKELTKIKSDNWSYHIFKETSLSE